MGGMLMTLAKTVVIPQQASARDEPRFTPTIPHIQTDSICRGPRLEGTSKWETVQRAQAGDVAAQAQLYAEYRDPVFRFIYNRIGGRRVLAEDLAADVWVRALKSIGSYADQGKDFGAWLTTIARNLVYDHFKSGRYRLETPVDEIREYADGIDRTPQGAPEASTLDYISNLALLAALRWLSDEQREALILRYLVGLTVTETAQALGKNEGAVKALCYRGTISMKRLLLAQGFLP
jgi:RNA polymerase sigma-70 factor (ECF subfamily)